MLPQPATALAALLVWGGVLCDALLVSVGGGAPPASIERARASSATTHAAPPARRTSTISAQLQSAPPPEGFEWGYDSSAAAADAGAADAASSPEELLLKAIEALREQDLARARELLAQARAACEHAGGPTDEQASLLELVAARESTAAAPRPPPKPPPAAASARPIGGAPTTAWDANLASDASVDDLNFPGTIAAPTGSSLIMPGTPSMAELAARMDEKRRVAAAARAKQAAARAEAERAEQRSAEAPPALGSEGDPGGR